MSPAALGLICGGLWFGTFLIGQTMILRCRASLKRSKVLVRGVVAAAAGAMITVAALSIARGTATLIAEIYTVMTVGCLFVLYGPFFYAVHTSISIETVLVLASRGGCAPLDLLTARFASRRLFDARLRTMVVSGYLVEEDNCYVLTLHARRVARLFAALKALWRLEAGG